jgi:autoinducer 2-degrading protein
MIKFAITAELEINPDQKSAFLHRLIRHRTSCLETEEGCLRFDILLPKGVNNRVVLYEVYETESAFDTHRVTPHFLAFRKDVEGMVVSRNITEFTLDDL